MELIPKILYWCFVVFLTCLLFLPVRVEARLGQKPPKDQVNTFIQQDLEKHRTLVEEWKGKWAVEHEQRLIAEHHLSKIKAELFRLSK